MNPAICGASGSYWWGICFLSTDPRVLRTGRIRWLPVLTLALLPKRYCDYGSNSVRSGLVLKFFAWFVVDDTVISSDLSTRRLSTSNSFNCLFAMHTIDLHSCQIKDFGAIRHRYVLIAPFQYAMLSGEIPFVNQTKNHCAAEIMSCIQKGEVKLEGEGWDRISAEAKELVKGENFVTSSVVLRHEKYKSGFENWREVGRPRERLTCLLPSRNEIILI